MTPEHERRHPRPHAMHGPRFLSLSRRLGALRRRSSASSARGAASLGVVFGHSTDWIGLLAIVALVGVGQALALEVDDGSISVSAVGSLAGAALFGAARCPRARDHDRRRSSGARAASPFHYVIFNVGTLSLASLAAAGVFTRGLQRRRRRTRLRRRGHRRRRDLLRRQHGPDQPRGRDRGPRALVARSSRSASPGSRRTTSSTASSAASSGSATTPAGLWALAVFAVPLLLMRKTQEAYLRHTQRSAQKLRAGGRDDPDPERLARAREQAPQGALDGRDGEPLGHRRRARRLHGRPLAPRPAARAGDRPRARPLAGRARPARPRGALPRHRQARDPGRDPAQAREPDRRRSGS